MCFEFVEEVEGHLVKDVNDLLFGLLGVGIVAEDNAQDGWSGGH